MRILRARLTYQIPNLKPTRLSHSTTEFLVVLLQRYYKYYRGISFQTKKHDVQKAAQKRI